MQRRSQVLIEATVGQTFLSAFLVNATSEARHKESAHGSDVILGKPAS